MNIAVLEGKLKLCSSKLFGGNAQNLLIAAHGGAPPSHSCTGIARTLTRVHRFKIPPWTTLYFYAPHGTVTNAEFEPYIKWKYPPLEAFMPGETVINYDLVHVDDDGFVCTTDKEVRNLLFTNRCHSAHLNTHHPFRFLDIVTTAPSYPAQITLKEVLAVLFRTGRIYPRIHCIFCRYELGRPENDYTPGYHNITPSS